MPCRLCALLTTLSDLTRRLTLVAAAQVSVSAVNGGALGAPGVPFLVLLQSAFRAGRNGIRRLLRQQPAAKLLSHTRQAVRPGVPVEDHAFPCNASDSDDMLRLGCLAAFKLVDSDVRVPKSRVAITRQNC